MTSETPDDIRLRALPPQLKTDLDNISDNLGISLTQMLKPILREVSDSFPVHLKKPPLIKIKARNEILIRGVSNNLITELDNISGNLGITITQIMIPKLQAFVDKQPPRMKQPLID